MQVGDRIRSSPPVEPLCASVESFLLHIRLLSCSAQPSLLEPVPKCSAYSWTEHTLAAFHQGWGKRQKEAGT